MLATVGGSGEVLHARLRGGRANPGRGGADFVAEAISRARYAGARGPITARADSGFHNYPFAAACRRRGARFSVTARNMHGSIARRIAEIPEEDWLPVEDMEYAEAAEIPHQMIPPQKQRNKKQPMPVRLIVRRMREKPLPLFPELEPIYRHHAHVTDRDGDLLDLERDHRRHAECEPAIKDLKYGMALNHFPSGNFCANAAWLWIQALSLNICRWLIRIGDPRQGVLNARTVRRRILQIPGRITRSGRKNVLRLPLRWPWAGAFLRIRSAILAKPLPA